VAGLLLDEELHVYFSLWPRMTKLCMFSNNFDVYTILWSPKLYLHQVYFLITRENITFQNGTKFIFFKHIMYAGYDINIVENMRFEVLTEVEIMMLFWAVPLYGLVGTYRFAGTYCLHIQG
jgi:hypothetical protein